MIGELLLSIDVGTGSCRAVLFSLDGAQVAIGQREYAHLPAPGVPGSQVFDTDRNWALICECIREALASARVHADAVKSVSATSMREGMVLYDGRGREIWACPNADSRANEQAAALAQSGAAAEIYQRAGDWVSITAPARFLWIAANEPDVLDALAHVGMLADWVLTRLSGEFVTDPSLGSSSGMFDLAERDWSDYILELCGLTRAVCPPVTDAGTHIGGVSRRAAEETGLRPDTPVVVGGADTQLALVGIGVGEPGRLTAVGGTFWQHTVVLDKPLIDPQARLRTLCHSVAGRWMMEGIGFYCGLVMRWFRDAFCEPEKRLAELEGRDVYDLLEEQAALAPPGCGGMFGIFSNLMTAQRWMHAAPAFIGFDVTAPERSGKKECIRSIEEAAAYVSRGHFEIVEELLGQPAQELIFTGGAAKGVLWPQILADVLGIPVKIPAVKESSALGAALYAGVGIGTYSTTDDIERRFDRTVEPQAPAHAIYQQLYRQWLELYPPLLELSNTGVVAPLWRGAGT
jgi:autoinducer 2 (AI-2) kinase